MMLCSLQVMAGRGGRKMRCSTAASPFSSRIKWMKSSPAWWTTAPLLCGLLRRTSRRWLSSNPHSEMLQCVVEHCTSQMPTTRSCAGLMFALRHHMLHIAAQVIVLCVLLWGAVHAVQSDISSLQGGFVLSCLMCRILCRRRTSCWRYRRSGGSGCRKQLAASGTGAALVPSVLLLMPTRTR